MVTKAKSDPKEAIMAGLKDDAQFKKFRNIVATLRLAINVEKDMTEALSLHSSRISRSLYAKPKGPRILLEASLMDLSFRSRLTEIRIQLSRNNDILNEAVKAIKRYINTEFNEELNSYSNVEQKRNMVERVIASTLDLQSSCESTIATIDDLIKDIDQSAYQLKNAVDILKLIDGSKGTRNI
jgi:hypothetical protein